MIIIDPSFNYSHFLQAANFLLFTFGFTFIIKPIRNSPLLSIHQSTQFDFGYLYPWFGWPFIDFLNETVIVFVHCFVVVFFLLIWYFVLIRFEFFRIVRGLFDWKNSLKFQFISNLYCLYFIAIHQRTSFIFQRFSPSFGIIFPLRLSL
jgi:hypothetical protein